MSVYQHWMHRPITEMLPYCSCIYVVLAASTTRGSGCSCPLVWCCTLCISQPPRPMLPLYGLCDLPALSGTTPGNSPAPSSPQHRRKQTSIV
ncbi:hypothetical protein GDO81_029165 [Engystomops pustulosus]|uniref:Uncharacterized protein n=1 Tax=Engystomops pustulosus TaxID=76066 RepID=A0AAV6ZFM9_ENGPU|nr:hypothetical protein GDO81_029165 [Engystomops pustulosus]